MISSTRKRSSSREKKDGSRSKSYGKNKDRGDKAARRERKSKTKSSSGGSSSNAAPIIRLPMLKDTSAQERQSLFIKKLEICIQTLNFRDPSVDPKAVDYKKQTLIELVDYINSNRGVLTETLFPYIVKMVSNNIFRAIHMSDLGQDIYDPEDDDPVLEAAWPHLQYVYEFLLRFVLSPEVDPKIAKKYIDSTFIIRLLDLFDTEDPRERDYLKTVLHRIYAKFMSHRAFIRKQINNIFYCFIYETERHNGIAELLEILGSIINGFALPLKQEHKIFLNKVLIPLHRVRVVAPYHSQLAYCVTQFVEKDVTVAATVMKGILRFWPFTNSPKEVLFLSEVEEILEVVPQQELVKFMTPLFSRVARSIGSCHFQVSERGLSMLSNEYLLAHISNNREVLMPILFQPLCANTKNHWNSAVLSLTYNNLKMLMDLDSDLFTRCANEYKQRNEELKRGEEDRRKRWLEIEIMAKRNAQRVGKVASLARLEILDPEDNTLEPKGQEEESDSDYDSDVSSDEDSEDDMDIVGNLTEAAVPPKRNYVRRKSLLPHDDQVVAKIKDHVSLEEKLKAAQLQ